jgi:hemoglobin
MRITPILGTLVLSLALIGCGGGAAEKDRTFSTSGSREADQRAEQRMARDQQLKGGADEGRKKESADTGAVVAPAKKTLFERLGGEEGVAKIVDDFVTRLVADPQVNFERKGIKVGGLGLSRNRTVEWQATPATLAEIKKNLAQFVALRSGGPTRYDGPEFKTVAEGKKVTNAEFDAAVGDLKATLEKLQIAVQEQKELLAMMESTKPQFVEER